MTVFFAVSVAVLGVFIPFWPAWLEARGSSKLEIGRLVAAWAWSRGLAGPVLAHFVDRSGRRRQWILALSAASALAFAPFVFANSFAALLAVTVLFGALHAQVIPLGENMILFESRRLGFSYASVRWFGSTSFLVVSVLTGWMMEDGAAHRAYSVGLVFLLATCAAAAALPRGDAAPVSGRRAPLRELAAHRAVLFVLIGVGVLQASHAAYYAYSTLHWSAAGHSTTAIGWLWAEGVIAEIALFVWFGRRPAAVSERALLALAVAGSLARWSCLASTTDLSWLVATQWMHAFTFAAAHLAAMTFLARSVGVDLSATAQSVYSSVNIAAHATTVALAAPLFDAHGGAVFWPMIPIALAGGALAYAGLAGARERT